MKLKLKENSSTFLVKVYDNDEDNVRCNFAIVKITNKLLEEISKLRKGRDELDCYEVVNFNYSCKFLNQDEFEDEVPTISDELVDELEEFTKDNKGAWQIEDVSLENIPLLITDVDTLHVSEFGVKWTTYGKHSDVRFSTEKISWEQIEKIIL